MPCGGRSGGSCWHGHAGPPWLAVIASCVGNSRGPIFEKQKKPPVDEIRKIRNDGFFLFFCRWRAVGYSSRAARFFLPENKAFFGGDFALDFWEAKIGKNWKKNRPTNRRDYGWRFLQLFSTFLGSFPKKPEKLENPSVVILRNRFCRISKLFFWNRRTDFLEPSKYHSWKLFNLCGSI